MPDNAQKITIVCAAACTTTIVLSKAGLDWVDILGVISGAVAVIVAAGTLVLSTKKYVDKRRSVKANTIPVATEKDAKPPADP